MELKTLLRMSQQEIKDKALALPDAVELEGTHRNTSVFVKGEAPYVLVAHMDTVYESEVDTIISERGQIKAPYGATNGIGGDDRCGCWILFQMAERDYRPSLLFCEDEEACGLGSSAGLDEYDWSDQKCFVEIDGPGFGVFYSGSGSNNKLDSFMEDVVGLHQLTTSYNDISEICTAGNPPGITLGAAYYNHHQAGEEWISVFGLEVQLRVVEIITASIDKLEWSVIPKRQKTYGTAYGYKDEFGYGHQYGGAYTTYGKTTTTKGKEETKEIQTTPEKKGVEEKEEEVLVEGIVDKGYPDCAYADLCFEGEFTRLSDDCNACVDYYPAPTYSTTIL